MFILYEIEMRVQLFQLENPPPMTLHDRGTPPRAADELLVHARVLRGDDRRRLAPADDDGRHPRIQQRREHSLYFRRLVLENALQQALHPVDLD